jgi:hypothetical protein
MGYRLLGIYLNFLSSLYHLGNKCFCVNSNSLRNLPSIFCFLLQCDNICLKTMAKISNRLFSCIVDVSTTYVGVLQNPGNGRLRKGKPLGVLLP